ncbi:MAG: hypothetical protein IPM35_36085 [Myxococcales bacterium]|nr:hypothetical protein [Myxococcales bacterium]
MRTSSIFFSVGGGAVVLAVAGFLIFDRHSKLPGEGCGGDSSCKAVPGYAAPKCEQLADHKHCVVPCKEIEPEDRVRGTLGKRECPAGLTCRKLSYSRYGSGDWLCVPP